MISTGRLGFQAGEDGDRGIGIGFRLMKRRRRKAKMAYAGEMKKRMG